MHEHCPRDNLPSAEAFAPFPACPQQQQQQSFQLFLPVPILLPCHLSPPPQVLCHCCSSRLFIHAHFSNFPYLCAGAENVFTCSQFLTPVTYMQDAGIDIYIYIKACLLCTMWALFLRLHTHVYVYIYIYGLLFACLIPRPALADAGG
uniref:Uncharacterized protein n=1 Tax=Schistocephalus solidus TaxID=70667 RepID=A0A0X3QBV5_SCHSO